MTSAMPSYRPFTVDDLDGFPSDGNRYELIEGSLHVSPAPVPLHQRIVVNVLHLLEAACPEHLEVLGSPIDVRLGPDTQLQPDVLVTAIVSDEAKRIEGPPLLAVEVLSPSTRLYDLGTKRLAYRGFGVGGYWVVDPEGPRLTAWRWEGDTESEQTAEGHSDHVFDWPYPVAVTPARLLLPHG